MTDLTWASAEAIVNRPEVHEALQNFAEDITEDNGIGVVLAVLAAHAKATNDALRALQLVRLQCGDEITGLIVPSDSRTLDAIVDQAIEGLTK